MAVSGILSAAAQRCVHHPLRVGHATCMACRKVVCQDCATTFDGINYCRPCMALRQGAAGAGGAWPRHLMVVVQLAACAGGLLLTARVAAWSLAVVRSWGS